MHNTNSSHQVCSYSNTKPQTTNGLQRQSISMAESQTMQTNNGNSKRKRSWSRAVFSQLQRKGLEIQFQIQKYITKPDRRKLAARLGLTDAQVNFMIDCSIDQLFDLYVVVGESMVSKSAHEMETYQRSKIKSR